MSYVKNVLRMAPRAMPRAAQRRILEVTGEHVDGFRDHVILSLALGTALREHEIVALDIRDVVRGSLKPAEMARGLEPIRSKIQLTTFKRSPHEELNARAAAARQRVFLPRMVRVRLAKFLDWKKRAREDLRPHAPLFVSRFRRRLSARQLRNMFRAWQQRAGFEEYYTFHALRHTALTNLYLATKDLLLVQQQARHAHATTTEIYAHVSDEDVRRAVEEMPS